MSEEMTLAQIITSYITPMITEILSVCGQVVQTITGSPYLMLTTGFLVLGGSIKIVRALLRK